MPLDNEGLTLSPTPVPGAWSPRPPLECCHKSSLDLLGQPWGQRGKWQARTDQLTAHPPGQLCVTVFLYSAPEGGRGAVSVGLPGCVSPRGMLRESPRGKGRTGRASLPAVSSGPP